MTEPPESKPPSLNHYSAGLEFALTILVFVGIGWWLDGWLNTSPWLLVVFLFVGFSSSLYLLVKKVNAK
ncbi:MAG: AtpZ/AtpI family protein [Planctomycetota bacterium]